MLLPARLEAAEDVNASVKNADDGDTVELEHAISNTGSKMPIRKEGIFAFRSEPLRARDDLPFLVLEDISVILGFHTSLCVRSY
mmetsp:Transcript_25415/g.51765  ORF Transcript_25415/g.51765 Transcript_25415/m.51765 type:complete len:84 (-) Transcript_25415:75-326(-)